MNLDTAEAIRLIRKGKQAEQTNKVLGGCLAYLVRSALNALFGGWMLMLAVGVIHFHWLPSLPTVGYWVSVLLVLLMRGVFSRMPVTKETK